MFVENGECGLMGVLLCAQSKDLRTQAALQTAEVATVQHKQGNFLRARSKA